MSASPSVAVIVVSHDGARWLPGVVEGIAEQGTSVARVVAVDTGSKDASADLLETAYGAVTRSISGTSYPAAVRLGLEQLDREGAGHEWLWLLHDDSRPAPGALDALLEAAADHPDADVLGPKLREWPSLRRLLEVGVTISGTGRRETGLERGEYDQGQHDQQRPVLAVNTAGMLVRRRVLDELGGFDDQLAIFGNDLDFGWRAAAAGHTTLVVPEAVVFHAEAAHRGLRRTPLTGRHTHYQERRAALYTLLANGPARALPFQVVRLTFGTLLRMIGFLLVRSVGDALDDLAALVSVLASPGDLRAARRRRRGRTTGDPDAVRALLAPTWLPYRHGLDVVGDVAAAVTNQAADVAERRRVAAAEHDPSSLAARRVVDRANGEGDDELTDTGVVARFLTNPVALALAAVVLLAMVGARTAYGEVSGGALSPVPADAGDWWRLHYESWHQLGTGTDVPAPPLVLPLAMLAVLLGTSGAVTFLLLLAVPFGLWGAWRFLRVCGRLVSPLGAPRWLLVAGATTYALVPVTSGAWGQGRLGLVVAASLLPWAAHAVLGFADPDPDRRWRAAWRTGLLLTLVTAFSPVAWLLGVALAVVVLAASGVLARAAVRRRSVWGPPGTALLVPLTLLSPWWVPALVHGAGGALVLEAGRQPSPSVDPLDVLAGRVGDLGAPTWVGLILLVLAVLAIIPRATRIPVTLCWMVALVSVGMAALLGLTRLSLSSTSSPPGLGILVVAVQACLVTAAVIGAQGASRARTSARLRAVVAVAGVAAAVVPLTGLGWFMTGDDRLTSESPSEVPAYMVQSAVTGPEHGIVLVRGDVGSGLTYAVLRGDGVTLGEDEILALADERPDVTTTMRDLLSRPTGSVVDRLGALGVEYVLLPPPADGRVAAGLDATSGLTQASTQPGTRAWQVTRALDPDAVDGPGSWWRVLLLVVQGLGLLLVLVLAAPTLRRGRR